MSKIIASAAIRGAYKIAEQAEEILSKAIKEKGNDCRVEFPNTGYYMPIIYSMTGRGVETLADFEEVLKEVKDLLPPHVDEDLCIGCGRCEKACQFNAAKVALYDGPLPVSRVNEALCKGCGACTVACPTGAISVRHFKSPQIEAMIDALAEE